MEFKIEWKGAHPNNYYHTRVYGKTGRAYKPIAIVNHIMEGSLNGTASWFNNPNSEASTNYGIGRDGRIYHFVNEDVACPYANGKIQNHTWKIIDEMTVNGTPINPNFYTISIEHEGYYTDKFTEEMYQATLWLHKQLIKKYDIPIDRDHIIGHYRIDGVSRKNCPGPNFPWDRLFTDLLAWQEEERLKMSWEVELGLKAVKSLTKKGIIDTPQMWTANKMLENTPTWLIMTLIDRITDEKKD